MFEELEQQVQFSRDQILTQDTTDSLQQYANAGLQGINYTQYISQTRSIISTLDVGALINTLEMIRDQFNAISVSNKIL